MSKDVRVAARERRLMQVMRTTIRSRGLASSKLSRLFEKWRVLSDEDIFAEVKILWPSVTEASREECIKFLTMDFVEKNFI